MTRYYNTKKKTEVHFDSADQWINYATNKVVNNDKNFFEITDSYFQGEFNGVEMVKRIKNRQCNKSTRKSIHEKSVNLPALSTETSEQDIVNFYSDQQGLFLDTVAYHNGEPDNMIAFDIQENVRPIVWLACNIGGLWTFEDSQFKNRGIALIRAIHALERAGVSIGLIGYSKAAVDKYYNSGHRTALQTIVVKQPHNALDETTLINIFADKNAFRTIGFAVRRTLTDDEHMGATCSIKIEDLEHSHAKGHKVVILPYDNTDIFNSSKEATDWTIKQIKTQAKLNF